MIFVIRKSLIRILAENVVNGCKSIGLKSFVSQKKGKDNIKIPLILDDSWKKFHSNPKNFIIWEEKMVNHLKTSLLEN